MQKYIYFLIEPNLYYTFYDFHVTETVAKRDEGNKYRDARRTSLYNIINKVLPYLVSSSSRMVRPMVT